MGAVRELRRPDDGPVEVAAGGRFILAVISQRIAQQKWRDDMASEEAQLLSRLTDAHGGDVDQALGAGFLHGVDDVVHPGHEIRIMKEEPEKPDQPMTEPEQSLPGGGINVVTRVGDTVRRPVGTWTPAVHALLGHLEQQRFFGAPCDHGIDDGGREVLDFLPGEVGNYPLSLIDHMETSASAGDEAFAQHIRDGHADLYRRDIAHFQTYRAVWQQSVLDG